MENRTDRTATHVSGATSNITGVKMTDVPDDVLAHDAARQDSPVSVKDLVRFADIFSDLGDPDVMSQAWR